ncbi:hypothetical protein J6590_023321 [Homalodisca vitripennis]|nr:hypothetical protein J6590_023321 [Homalodisca vitripennis]
MPVWIYSELINHHGLERGTGCTIINSADPLNVANYILINLTQEYCFNKKLIFNEAKTTQLILGKLKGKVIEPTNIQALSSTRHLEVVLDDQLAWTNHIDSLCLKLSEAVFAIKLVQFISTNKTTRICYHALFESHIRSEQLESWLASTSTKLYGSLQKSQNSAPSLYTYEVVLHATKLPLVRNSDIHTHNTRSENNFKLFHLNSTLYSKKPTYAGAKLFYILPQEVKREPPALLRGRPHRWLLRDPVYSLKEYME